MIHHLINVETEVRISFYKYHLKKLWIIRKCSSKCILAITNPYAGSFNYNQTCLALLINNRIPTETTSYDFNSVLYCCDLNKDGTIVICFNFHFNFLVDKNKNVTQFWAEHCTSSSSKCSSPNIIFTLCC